MATFHFNLTAGRPADDQKQATNKRPQKGGNNVIPFPDKKYSIIYADPPWSYSDSGCSGAAAAQYATMSINELKQLPVNPAGGV